MKANRVRKTMFKNTLVAQPLFFICLAVGSLAAQNGNGGSDKKGAAALFGNVKDDIDKAIEVNESLLNSYPNSEFTPSVMFQLVELYFQKANDEHQTLMGRYEEEMVKFDNGQLENEPTIPRVSFQKATRLGYRLLQEYPTAPFVDKVIYRIALCHLQEGNDEVAFEYFNKLTNDYGNSAYLDESNFRKGEQAFERHDYRTAIKHYELLKDRFDSPYFAMSLYKLAWAYYNIGEHSRAISTFIYMIDDLSQLEKEGVDDGRSADLREEAITYVAESFTEHGGARAAEKFLLDIGEKEYSKTIFIRLGELYQERNFYEESNEVYAAILRIWPLHHTAPEVQAKIIKNYLLTENTKETEEARIAMVKNYGPGSEWLNKHPEGEGRAKALELVEESLYILATESQQRGMETKNRRDLTLAVARYQEYLDKFPGHERAEQVQFYQAEAYYELGDFENASKAYENVVATKDEPGKLASDAAYNRVLSAFNILDNTQSTAQDSIIFYLEDFLGRGETHPVKTPSKEFGDMLQACNDFAKYLPDDGKAPEVLMKYGEALFNLERFDLSQQAYTAVVNRGSETQFTLQAYNMIAQSAYQQERFDVAEAWYGRIRSEYPDSLKYSEQAATMISSSRFKKAEDLLAAGKGNEAAEAFQNVAATTDNIEIAEQALLKAAVNYEEAGEISKAIPIYENLRYRLPQSTKIEETLYKAAILSEKLPDYARAAANYLELVRSFPQSKFAGRSVYNAAVNLERAENFEQAANFFEKYAYSFSEDPAKQVEAVVKAGEYAFKKQDDRKAQTLLKKALVDYAGFAQQGELIDPYFPAQAQFLIARMYYSEYVQVDIGGPKTMARDLKSKQALLKRVATACDNAIKFKNADWVTASLYLKGAAMEEFARALDESPAPAGLQGADLQAYKAALAKQSQPYKDAALKQYQQSIQVGERTNLSNEWMDRSRIRVNQLQQGGAPTSAPGPNNTGSQDTSGLDGNQ